MPIPVPNLADLDALVLSQSMVERLTSPAATRAIIQAHTPEYTNPRPGDPGLTLIDLFAWLGETILYRANLIPERQRLAFLRLLGEPLRPARAAEGVVSLRFDSADADKAVTLPPSTPFPGSSRSPPTWMTARWRPSPSRWPATVWRA